MAAAFLESEITLPDTTGHARLKAWESLAWSVAPVSLVDCFGQTVVVKHPSLIQGADVDARSEPWVDEILDMGPVSSPKLRAAAINAFGDQPPDFLNFMSVTGESAAARQQRFMDLDTLQDLHAMQAERRDEARRNLLTANSAAGRANNFDTWVEWTFGAKRLPFRWHWVLGDRMSTSQFQIEESVLQAFTGYLSVRFASFGSVMAALDALKFFHSDYLGACPLVMDRCYKLARQLSLIDKLMMRLEPCRKQRDVLSPNPSLEQLGAYWRAKAQGGGVQAILACMHHVTAAACFTSGLRVQSVCPGEEWFSSGDRAKFWSLYTLVQLEALCEWEELSEQAQEFHSRLNRQVLYPRLPTDPAEDFILIAPPKQKTIYASKRSNEIARRRWPYERYPGTLNLPTACFQLFARLDRWAPGWRLVAHRLPAVFDPRSVELQALRQAISGERSVPPVEPLSPGVTYRELHTAVLAALPTEMHDLKIGDHVYRKSCHVAWSEMSVVIGGQTRRLTEPERDRCLGRSTQWSSEHGSARDYDETALEMVRVGARAAARSSFTVLTVLDGRLSDHSKHSAVAASTVNGASIGLDPKRRRVAPCETDVLDYADDTEHLQSNLSPATQASQRNAVDGWALVSQGANGQ